MTRWEEIRKINWDHEYAENGIINETDFNKELASLKKVYNDLAESHAKQLIEIGELNKEKDARDKHQVELFNKLAHSESELLKAKELFNDVLNGDLNDGHQELIIQYLNKK